MLLTSIYVIGLFEKYWANIPHSSDIFRPNLLKGIITLNYQIYCFFLKKNTRVNSPCAIQNLSTIFTKDFTLKNWRSLLPC